MTATLRPCSCTTVPFPDVPARPLRVVYEGYKYPRKHHRKCPHAWVWVRPSDWTAAQRDRANPAITDRPMWEYTPGCEGCNDLVAWHQWQNRMHRRRHEPQEVPLPGLQDGHG